MLSAYDMRWPGRLCDRADRMTCALCGYFVAISQLGVRALDRRSVLAILPFDHIVRHFERYI